MEMVNRYSSPGSFRYGFNGKEKDNEDYGEGNSYDYGNRIYNSRLGKFLSTDPISSEYPELSPYQFASDRPIDGIDRDGLEWFGDPSVPYEIARAILFGWVDDVKEGGLNIREGTTQRGAAENNAASYNNSQVPQKVQDILKANNKASGTEKMVRGTNQMIQGGIEGVSAVVPLGEEVNGVRQVGKVVIKKVEQKALSMGVKASNNIGRRALESSGKAIARESERIIVNLADNAATNAANIGNAKWAQTTFGKSFNDAGSKFFGRTVDELSVALNSGKVTIEDVQIDVVVRNSQTFILNTKSSAALTRAGIPRNQWKVVNRTGEAFYENQLNDQFAKNPKISGVGTNTIRESGTTNSISH
jgi:RHS repeat-associated protein